MFDDYILVIMQKDVCNPINDYPEYINDEFKQSFNLKQCQTIAKGVFSKGFIFSLNSFF